MKRYNSIWKIFFVGTLIISLSGCSSTNGNSINPTTGTTSTGSTTAEVSHPSNRNDTTHGNDSEPDYEVVFPQDSVNRIDITLSTESWAGLQAEMAEQFGGQGAGSQALGGQNFNNPKLQPNLPQGQQPPAPGNLQPGNRPGNANPGGSNFGDTSYVTSTVSFNGETWEYVGFRYSGNSTLQRSWKSGTNKISFRLDFDEFEDEYPLTKNQRFYGFKQISFKSNAMDDSYIREKVVTDIFREAGVVSSQTAFYEVYVDFGEGPQYFGVYTAVEIVDDTVIETQFAEDGGNVYKPEGAGAAFVDGTFNETAFEKQTNQDEADWSDIEAVFAALNSDLRTSDPAAWRADLETVFDVDAFIRWLAVDTIIQNWDTYGAIAHNYYLYTDPTDGLVTWIPWDNNEALGGRSIGGGGGQRGARDLDLKSVGVQWPLIRFLMDDPVYLEKYQQSLEETIEGVWQPDQLAAKYQKYHNLIEPYVQKEMEGYTQLTSMEAFNQSLEELIQHAKDRTNAVMEYLAGNEGG